MMGEIVATDGAEGRDVQQSRLIDALMDGKSDQEAAQIAGYGSAVGMVNASASETVQKSLLSRRTARIRGSLASKALKAIEELIEAPQTPAATRFAASRWILEQAGHSDTQDDGRDKPLHEMTEAELLAFMAKAQGVVDRGEPGVTITVVPDNRA